MPKHIKTIKNAMKTNQYTTDNSDRVSRIVERDSITTANLRALFSNGAETPQIFQNTHSWLVKAALRRHRKAQVEAGPHFNNGLTNALDRVKVRIVNGRRV